MKILTILALLMTCCLPIKAQTGSTLMLNGKARVIDWSITRDSVTVNGLRYKFTESYNKDNVRIGFLYKTCEGKIYKYKIRIELYDNPIKRVTIYNAQNKIIENFDNNDDN